MDIVHNMQPLRGVNYTHLSCCRRSACPLPSLRPAIVMLVIPVLSGLESTEDPFWAEYWAKDGPPTQRSGRKMAH